MDTNFMMVRKLDNWTPENGRIITMPEIYHVNRTLCLDEMDELQLRNLRDFVVMYYGLKDYDPREDLRHLDKMSAITSVIDNKLYNLKAEV